MELLSGRLDPLLGGAESEHPALRNEPQGVSVRIWISSADQ
jgi:hypothetical protein